MFLKTPTKHSTQMRALESSIPVVNSQVFIRGGNYIASDMLLRTSTQRYQDEVRMHAEVLTRSPRNLGTTNVTMKC